MTQKIILTKEHERKKLLRADGYFYSHDLTHAKATFKQKLLRNFEEHS